MESQLCLLHTFSSSVNILPYYGLFHVVNGLMLSIDRQTRHLWSINHAAFHNAFAQKQNKRLKIKRIYRSWDINKDNDTDDRYFDIGTYEFLLKNQRYSSYKLSFIIDSEESIKLLNTFISETDINLLKLNWVKIRFSVLNIEKIMSLIGSQEYDQLQEFVNQHTMNPLCFDVYGHMTHFKKKKLNAIHKSNSLLTLK